VISVFRFHDAPSNFRSVFSRGSHGHTWLAVVPGHMRKTWDAFGVPALSTYWDASDKVWILAGNRGRPAAARVEAETGDLWREVRA